MPLNFPTSGLTANETTYTFSGNTWIWNGYAWDAVVTPASVGIAGYVSAINGLSGAVTGIAVTGSNTFTGLQTMNAGITANNLWVTNGVTFGDGVYQTGLAQFAGGITANNLRVTNGVTFASTSVHTGLATFNAGVTANNFYVSQGATFASNISAPNVVYSFNGNSGTVTYAPPLATSSVTGVASFGNEFTVSALGAVSLTANYVKSWNGSTGAVTFSNYVTSVNGATGVISSIAVTGANTFTGLQTMNAGLTANNLYVSQGVTFNSTSVHTGLATFNAGVTANNLWVTNGATFASRAAFTQGFTASNVFVNGGATFAGANTVAFTAGLTANNVYGGTVYTNNIVAQNVGSPVYINDSGAEQITYIGDYSGAGSSTYIEVNDATNTITLNGLISSINAVGGVQGNTIVSNTTVSYGLGPAYIDSVSTALTTTASNQTVWDVYVGAANQVPYSSDYRSMEFMIQAATGTTFEAMKMLVIHDDGNTWNTQYGAIRNGLTMGSYTTTIVDVATSRYLRLRVSPTYRGTKFTVAGTILTA